MANLLPQPGHGLELPAAPATPRYRTYQELYGDATIDPYQGNYARIMSRFDIDENPGVTYLMLYEQAVGAGLIPQAFICCSNQRQSTRIYCVHMASKFVSALDGTTTPWDGLGFATLGDVTQANVTTIHLPDTIFRPRMNTRVKTLAYFEEHLDELGAYGLAPPEADEDETELVSTRQIMFLPNKYAALLMQPAGYTVRQVWDILRPAMADNGDLNHCRPLLKWLRVASTGVMRNNALGTSNVMIELTPPLADAALIKHRQHYLHNTLPALFKTSDTLEAAITQMAVAVTQNTNDTRIARERKAALEATPKLPSEKFNNTLPILLSYLQIADENNVPPLWHQWANCSKRQEYLILTELLNSYARSPETFSVATPVVTPKIVQDLLAFRFVGESPEDIKMGIQPFIIADGSVEQRQANLEVAQLYGLLHAGDNGIMLADLERLKAKETQSLPLNYFELERNLGMFGNFLGTILGSTHILTTSYRTFWSLLTQTYRTDLQQHIDVKHFIKPAHLLRSIQLVCFNWFTQKRSGVQPSPPDFTYIVYNIALHTYVLPHLPSAIYKLAYPKATTGGMGSDAPSLGSSSVSSHSGTSTTLSNSDTQSSNASIVSGITLPTLVSRLTTPGTNQLQRKSSVVANLQPDKDMQRLLDYGMTVKDLMGTDPPPTLTDGSQICLSFHLRNSCWSNCKRAASHHPLSATERQQFETYVKTQVAKLRSPRPTSQG